MYLNKVLYIYVARAFDYSLIFFSETDAKAHGNLLNKEKQHINIYLINTTQGKKHNIYKFKKKNMNNFVLIVRPVHIR